MQVICQKNRADAPVLVLPYNPKQELSENNFVASSEGETVDGAFLQYRLTVGQEYTVYAVLIYGGDVRYLLSDDDHLPHFFPIGLFQIRKKEIPWDWECAEYRLTDGSILYLGYPDPAADYAKLRDLVDGKPSAVREFLDYQEHLRAWT